MRKLFGALKLLAYLLQCLVMIPMQIVVCLLFKGRARLFLPMIFHKISCAIYGIRTHIEGTPLTSGPVLMVGNHLSHLDIPAIGQMFPQAFVAKKDVASWPLFGLLAKLQQTAFVDRARHKALEGRDLMQNRLKDATSPLVLFAEGTSSIGNEVLSFKSSMFEGILNSEIKNNLLIQPFTVTLLSVDGHPADTQAIRDLYAWYVGSIEMIPHLLRFGSGKGAEILLTFHPPRRAADYDDRKALAQDCHADVAAGLAAHRALDFQPKAA